MSEEIPSYGANTAAKIKPACLHRYSDPEYQPPGYEDVVALKSVSGRTGGDLAKLAGVEPRTFRKWVAPPDARNSAKIPYSAWRLLLIELGLVEGRQ